MLVLRGQVVHKEERETAKGNVLYEIGVLEEGMFNKITLFGEQGQTVKVGDNIEYAVEAVVNDFGLQLRRKKDLKEARRSTAPGVKPTV